MVLLKPFRYCGEYYDKETDSIYLRARYYNPALGRFTTEDPAKDGLNWYVYCGNNLVIFVDPTGETLKDAVYGSLETLDSNIFSGAATLIAEWLTGQEYNYKPENQEHYYVGRVVGDVFSALAGAKMIETGGSIILGGLGAEGGLAVVTDGASIALLDGAIAVSLTTAGTVTITYGGKTIVSSAKCLYNDVNSLIKLSNNNMNLETGKWNKGSFDSAADSLNWHFKKHGNEGGAKTVDEYLRKAEEYAKTAKKGAKKIKVSGEIEGVIRYKKNNKYIDIAPDGSILSFGKQ